MLIGPNERLPGPSIPGEKAFVKTTICPLDHRDTGCLTIYGVARDSIKSKILAILNTPGLELPEQDLLLQAIAWYADKNVDFVDAYNAAWLLARGLTSAYTFDQKHFSRLEGIRVAVPGE